MAEFSELIKNFNKCRYYVRDFFVYGFKSRQDFTSDKKSARTYDDERRRITSWLSEYVAEDMTEQANDSTMKTKSKVKNISLQIDSNLLDTNPLFSVWKTKSFTDNDILLHFYLLDIMDDNAYSAGDLADILSSEYSFPVDTQLVRRKCNEYVNEGLLTTEKDGKILLYRKGLSWNKLCSDTMFNAFSSKGKAAQDQSIIQSSEVKAQQSNNNSLQTALIQAISLFQLDSPFGYVGNTILDKLSRENQVFRIKHGFPTFTLEEEIAYAILEAKNHHSYVKMEIISNKNASTPKLKYGIPLKILVSTRTGRRYVCIYHMIHNRRQTIGSETPKFHFYTIRLDQIKSVTLLSADDFTGRKQAEINATIDAFSEQEQALTRNVDSVWGVSFAGTRTKVKLTLNIDEEYENFILNRLEREGKNGTVTKISDNTFLYEKTVFDANEMFPWLRTFIGRIIDIHFVTVNQDGMETTENTSLRKRFLNDIESVCAMYNITQQ